MLKLKSYTGETWNHAHKIQAQANVGTCAFDERNCLHTLNQKRVLQY